MRFYSLALFLFFLLVSFIGIAQKNIVVTEVAADCINAIDISSYKSIHGSAPIGPGKIMEIKSKKGDLFYFEKELFTVWYSFIAEENAILSFTITPDRAEDDYDFILYKFGYLIFDRHVPSSKNSEIRRYFKRHTGIRVS